MPQMFTLSTRFKQFRIPDYRHNLLPGFQIRHPASCLILQDCRADTAEGGDHRHTHLLTLKTRASCVGNSILNTTVRDQKWKIELHLCTRACIPGLPCPLSYCAAPSLFTLQYSAPITGPVFDIRDLEMVSDEVGIPNVTGCCGWRWRWRRCLW